MKVLRFILRRSVLLFALPLVTLIAIKLVYAQTSGPEPPGISQIIEGLMAIVGTWSVAFVANKIRLALGGSADIFLLIIVPALGAGVSFLVGRLGEPGNSWLVSFVMTLGSTWLDQLRLKLAERFR